MGIWLGWGPFVRESASSTALEYPGRVAAPRAAAVLGMFWTRVLRI